MGFIKFTPPKNNKLWFGQDCKNPEHNPPSMIVLQPGTHVYQCPGCGHKTTIIIPQVELSVRQQS